MGKGVLRNATLCLRHVVQEMTSSAGSGDDWISPWIEGHEGQSRLDWLRSLWTYRDQEVRQGFTWDNPLQIFESQAKTYFKLVRKIFYLNPTM